MAPQDLLLHALHAGSPRWRLPNRPAPAPTPAAGATLALAADQPADKLLPAGADARARGGREFARQQLRRANELKNARTPPITLVPPPPTELDRIFQPMLAPNPAAIPGDLDAPDMSAHEGAGTTMPVPSGHTLPVEEHGEFGVMPDEPMPLVLFDAEQPGVAAPREQGVPG